MKVPVLYLEETLDDSFKDWHFCIRYNGNDSYMLYGYRFNNKQDFSTRMLFLSRSSLVRFLHSAVDVGSSNVDMTMYFVDDDDINNDTFDSYYEAYRLNNELFGYDSYSFTESGLMDLLTILRDSRM
jgi:hypothetical protein